MTVNKQTKKNHTACFLTSLLFSLTEFLFYLITQPSREPEHRFKLDLKSIIASGRL